MMSNQEAVNWLINITADIGKAEQALDEIRQMLEPYKGEEDET